MKPVASVLKCAGLELNTLIISVLPLSSQLICSTDDKEDVVQDFPGGPVVKNLLAKAGDVGSYPSPGRSHNARGVASKPMCHNYRV